MADLSEAKYLEGVMDIYWAMYNGDYFMGSTCAWLRKHCIEAFCETWGTGENWKQIRKQVNWRPVKCTIQKVN